MTPPDFPSEHAAAILALYRAPLGEFIARRDALARELRATKQREAADRVKSLRKPSRIAWVLDSVAHEEPASIEQLAAAIHEAQTGADFRAALEAVKAAVRDVAAVAARVAIRAGQPIEPNAVNAAIHAVIGNAGAFAEFRSGQLVDVPEAGGLDLLAAVAIRDHPRGAELATPSRPSEDTRELDPRAHAAKQEAELAKAARANLRTAERSLAELSERSRRAAQSASKARENLEAAERALQHAQSDAQARRADFERAENDADAAAAAVQRAEEVVADARAHVMTD